MKTNQDKNIYIIGAGVSSLIAAQNLEQKGYVPTILEATGYIGGRVRTEIIDGWILDVGFQVLLDAYPMSKKYLNYADLDLQRLSPGARIYTDNDSFIIEIHLETSLCSSLPYFLALDLCAISLKYFNSIFD